MSKALRTYLRHVKRQEQGDQKLLSAEERLSLHRLRHEAHRAGAKLKDYGRGGLSPSLVLSVCRRDGFRCKIHGDRGEAENGGLTIHHKSGIVESEWASKKGHKNEKQNLVVLCDRAHDELHNRARANGTDSSQVLAEADKGTKHDHGQPEYKEHAR